MGAQPKLLKAIATVGGFTMISRVLGLCGAMKVLALST